MGVVLLLALIWVVVLVPPALRAHAARQEAFLVSLGAPPPDTGRPLPSRAVRVQRRRRIAGGLLGAVIASLLIGLLPTFRVLLVVHLFLLDSFIAYIALLAHGANRAARAAAAAAEPARAPEAIEAPEAVPARRRRERRPAPALLPELAPLA